MNFISYIVLLIIAYLIGTLSPATYIGKRNRVNIRELGSKNPGASNVILELGVKYGLFVAVVDILKGFVPILLLKLFGISDFDLYLIGTTIILGHIYPVWYKFKGGKGTATFLGVMLGINFFWGMAYLMILILFTLLLNYIVLATLVMYSVYLIHIYLSHPIEVFFITLVIPILSVILHIPNFKRIITKSEKGVRLLFRHK